MIRLQNRVRKLEEKNIPVDEEMIIDICFVGTPDSCRDNMMIYPPREVQIAENRAKGRKCFIVYSYGEKS